VAFWWFKISIASPNSSPRQPSFSACDHASESNVRGANAVSNSNPGKALAVGYSVVVILRL